MTHGYNYMPKYGSPVADTAEKAAAMARATGDPGSLVAAVDGGLLSAEQGRRVAAWLFALKSPCMEWPHVPLFHMFAMYPAAVVSADLAAALCHLIDDPNSEDDVKKLMPQVPTTALDNELVAKICAQQLGNYRRHADVALKILQRISVNAADSASDSIAHAATHLKGRLLARLERLVARIEAPCGAAFERYKAAALQPADGQYVIAS